MIPLKDDNPTASFAWVNIGLIIINCMVFIYQLSLGHQGMHQFILKMGAIPYEITHLQDIYPITSIPIPLTIFSSMFMHGGFLHIIGNMLYLWIFGDNVEDAMGHMRFILFYFICGTLASILHILVNPDSVAPMIGASGAIAGILGAYIILYPRTRILTLIIFIFFFRIIKIPAVFVLGFWFVLQLLNVQTGAGVAWYAHIGGFLAGVLLVIPFVNSKKKYM